MLIVLFEEEADDALLSALQAASTPPAPVASALAPTPLSTDRRGRPSSCGCPPAPLPGPISSPLTLIRGDSVTLLRRHRPAQASAGGVSPGSTVTVHHE